MYNLKHYCLIYVVLIHFVVTIYFLNEQICYYLVRYVKVCKIKSREN